MPISKKEDGQLTTDQAYEQYGLSLDQFKALIKVDARFLENERMRQLFEMSGEDHKNLVGIVADITEGRINIIFGGDSSNDPPTPSSVNSGLEERGWIG